MTSLSNPNCSYQSSACTSDAGQLLKDPFALTLHFVTDPGGGVATRTLIQPLVKWFDPSFRLFNIAERSKPNGSRGSPPDRRDDVFPALSVVLFLAGGDGDGELDDGGRFGQARAYLTSAPWRYHHRAATPGRVCLCEPNNPDFYTAEQEMPPWGVRQVHYGTEHLRFMLYTSRDAWLDMIRFYRLLLGRDVEYQTGDFCYFVVHATGGNMDVQLALKIVPEGGTCRPLSSAFLQFKVSEIGGLVSLLPNPCSPISPQRWQTTDPGGNVTLLLLGRRTVDRSLPRVKPRRHAIEALHTRPALVPRAGLLAVDDDEDAELSC